MMKKDWENILNRIYEWNGTRLELFHISEPSKRREFYGVVRFFFQTDDQKYQAKCLRISNSATACQLVNVLVEKFHPDLKMLTAGRFALYEYTNSTGERRLEANEAPLLAQLNYAFEDQEVRFILRDENKPLSLNRQQLAFENQPGALQPKPGKKSQLSAVSPGSNQKSDRGFTRRWSSGSRKGKQKTAVKQEEANGVAAVNRLPDSSFTRTLSNPDEVLRRRKQQRTQHRHMAAAEERATNSVKIYGEVLDSEVAFITLDLSVDDTSDRIVQWTLEKYGVQKQVHPQDLCLVQVNIPPRGTHLPHGIDREITLHNQDCPMAIRNDINARSLSPTSLLPGLSCVFQLRYRQGELGRSPPPPAPLRPRFPPAHGVSTPNGSLKQSRSSIADLPGWLDSLPELFCLKQVNNGDSEKDGLIIPLNDLFSRRYTTPIKVGTIEKMVGPPPNVLIDKMAYQDIRPIHCTLSVAQVSTSASRFRPPKACLPGELDAMTGSLSLLITPSLDGFAKPPGPAVVRLDGARITGPAIVQPNGLVQLGKHLVLRYIAPFNPTTAASSDEHRDAPVVRHGSTLPRSLEKSSIQDIRSPPANFATLPRRPGDMMRAEPNEYVSQRSIASDDNRNVVRGPSTELAHQPPIYGRPDYLPLGISLSVDDHSARQDKLNLLDQYVHAVDRILDAANAELQILSGVSPRGENRSAIFSLSPAYTLYLLYRACLRHITSTDRLSPSEQEQEISYLTNYIATRVYESLPHANHEEPEKIVMLHQLVYWLANSSELLYFFKNDIDLCSAGAGVHQDGQTNMPTNLLLSPVPICRPALNLLADSVDHCFHQLKASMTVLLQPLLFSLTNPGEEKRDEDARLDDKPITAEVYNQKCRESTSLQPLLQLLSLLMQLLRRMRVNAAITIQLFSHVYHVMAAFVFNQALLNTSAKPRQHATEDIPSLWLTRSGAKRLLRRLDKIKQWAQRQGLERAAECRFQRCVQACQLILANRTSLDNLYDYCMSLLSLNSLQLEWFLSHLGDTPSISDDWIDVIVTGGREVNDRAVADEMQHYYQDFQPCDIAPGEIQLTEIKELPFPLFLPPDGYASDTVLSGIPSGLKDFLQTLAGRGLLQVKKNPMDPSRNTRFPWTNYLKLNKPSNSDQALEDQSQRHVTMLPTSSVKAPAPASKPTAPDDESTDSETSSSGEEHQVDTEAKAGTFKPAARVGQYRPAPPGASKLYQRRQHSSLPDLSISEFQPIALQAGVPVSSVSRFYLKKVNNSLGLSIVAAKAEGQHQYGIYIKEIVPGGAAERHSDLETGDQILMIGSANLVGCAQSEAVATIAKHSRMQDGAQLTISKGAAQLHNIIDLIRSPGAAKDASKSSKSIKSIARRHDDQVRGYNEPPNRHPSAENRKAGALVTAPSTRVGVKHRDEGDLHARSAMPKTAEARGTSALSRSTPSLNLAEVGVDDPGTGAKQQGFLPMDDKRSYRVKPKDVNRMEYETESDDKEMRLLQSSSTASSGSDVLLECDKAGTGFERQELTKKYSSTGRKPVKTTPTGAPRGHSGLQTAKSQPNVFKPNTRPINTTVRRNSDGGGFDAYASSDQGIRPEESLVSDAFSSLESVSTDEQTPCSLHDSSGAFEPQPTAQVEKDLPGALVSTKKRIEHPPPPRAPVSTKPPPGRSSRHDQENELPLPNLRHTGKTYSPKRKSDDRSTQRSRLEPSSPKPVQSEQVKSSSLPRDGSPKQMTSGLPVYRLPEQDKTSEPGQVLGPGNSHGSRTTSSPLSSVTTVSADKHGEDNEPRLVASRRISPDTKVVERVRVNGSPTRRVEVAKGNSSSNSNNMGSRQTPPHLPLSVNVENRQSLDSLRPPSHAVIPGDRRWPEEGDKSPVPHELLQDLPALRSDPRKGRPQMSRKHLDAAAPLPSPSSQKDRYPGNGNSLTTPGAIAAMQYQPPWDQPGLKTIERISQNYQNTETGVVTKSPPQKRQPIVVPSRRSPTLPSSPPPIPTADFPQYHPPERLEPSEWNRDDDGYRASSSSLARHGVRREVPAAPELAPKPNVPGAFSYHRPPAAKHNTLPEMQKPEPAPKYPPLDSLHSPQRPIVMDPPMGHTSAYQHQESQHQRTASPASREAFQCPAAVRVAQLESELAALEKSNSTGVASTTLDRLRVELRFQRRLAERESSRRVTHTNRLSKGQEERLAHEPRQPADNLVECRERTGLPQDSSGQIWHQKRLEADQELDRKQRNRLAQLEADHQAMLERQEMRSKERMNWLLQRKQNSESRSFSAGELEAGARMPPPSILPYGASEDVRLPPRSDSQPRYGRPVFDAVSHLGDVQVAVPSRSGPQIVEHHVPRPTFSDSVRVKKSVSFDKNLETISVYSPPTTPRDSISDQLTALHFPMPPDLASSRLTETPSHTSNSQGPINSVANPESGLRPRPMGIIKAPSPASPASPNPVENAELLPFKEKMRLFAEQLGEEPPKERSRMSSRQRQLLNQPSPQSPSLNRRTQLSPIGMHSSGVLR